MSDLMTSQEVADLLGVTEDTARQWRRFGTGPQWFRLGAKAIRYRRSDVEAWIDEQISEAAK